MSTTENNRPPRPKMVRPDSADQIPKSLLELPQWVCWHFAFKEASATSPAKWTKVPVTPNGQAASSTDPDSWCEFEVAFEATKRNPLFGLGFVFAEGGFITGIDGDKCLDENGNPKAWAQPIIERFHGTYIEVSPSGTGLHIFCRGDVAGIPGRKRAYHDGGVEVYGDKRFFTFTGRCFRGAPLQLEEHQSAIRWLAKEAGLMSSGTAQPVPAPAIQALDREQHKQVIAIIDAGRENDLEFKSLFHGGKAHYFAEGKSQDKSHSEDDLAFVNLLAWGMGLDPSTIDAIFRASGQMRPKWDQHRGTQTYAQITIAKALMPYDRVLEKYGVVFARERTHADWRAHLARMFDVAIAIDMSGVLPADLTADPLVLAATVAAEAARLRSLPGFGELRESRRLQSLEDLESLRRAFDEAEEYTGARSQVLDNTPIMGNNVAPWPSPMAPEAFYGLAERFIEMAEPHTEADPNFLLLMFLTYAGNVIGRKRFIMAGGVKHYTNLFVVGVGPTSTGRKGSATGPVELFFKVGDRAPGLGNFLNNLSSGEGMIWAIHDDVWGAVQDKKTKQWEQAIKEKGIDDKRLLVNMGEFVVALEVMRREGNTLSGLIRAAWETGLLISPTKNSPAKATDAHVSIIGAISKDELLHAIQSTDGSNGFLNRFLWCCSRMSKLLPEGGRLGDVIESPEWRWLQEDFNRTTLAAGVIARNGDANDLWGYNDHPGGVYRDLARERYGLAGDATRRAHAQVLRLSVLYAALDRADEIRREHIDAALAVWRYCEDSARYIFGDAIGDPTADAILNALRCAPAGLTRTGLRDVFGRNQKEGEIARACRVLHERGLARTEQVKAGPKGGRPTETWFATKTG